MPTPDTGSGVEHRDHPPLFRPYLESDRRAMEALFDEFQDYFVPVDPLGRTRRMEGYGQVALREAFERIGPDGLFLVAQIAGGIVGFVAAVVSDTTPEQELEVVPGRWGGVTELFVRDAFRGRGLGRALMERAETFCREQGCATVRVEVFAPNQQAHRFYQGLGYADRDVDLVKPLWLP